MLDRRLFVAGTAAAVLAAPIVMTRANAATARLRKDVQALAASDPFFAKYAQAVLKMHQLPAGDPRNWRNQALIHINHCPHGTQTFVHWHRHYIHNFELICGEMIGDPDFALAYWNWSANNGAIPDPFFDVNQLNVQFWNDASNAQSDNWGPDEVVTIGTRGMSKGQGLQDDPNAGQFFTQDFIDTMKQSTRFSIFTRQLETSPHNNGHVISGSPNGHMVDGLSPLDPIFWLHHCNIDRIWAEWQSAGNTTPPFGLDYANQFVDGKGQPVIATSANALDFSRMNYNYDTLSGPFVAAQLERLGLPETAPKPVSLPPEATAEPQVLGVSTAVATVKVAMAASFTLGARSLPENLFKQRTFLASSATSVPRLATGTGRIFARLSGVMPPKGLAPLICKVFVNCPYLRPDTKASDPLCAGSFSFFGSHGGRHAHEDIYVDISGPLHVLFKDGAIDPAKVNIQLMAVGVNGAAADASFTVSKVEIVST